MFKKLKFKIKKWLALNQAKKEERKHIPSTDEIEEEHKQFSKEDKELANILDKTNAYYDDLYKEMNQKKEGKTSKNKTKIKRKSKKKVSIKKKKTIAKKVSIKTKKKSTISKSKSIKRTKKSSKKK